MKEKNNNNYKIIEWLILIIFFTIGLCIMIGSLYACKINEEFKENAMETTATVIDVVELKVNDDMEYRVKYKYKVNGLEYESQETTNIKKQKGQNEIVYYDRVNPENMKLDITNYSLFLFIFSLIYLIPFVILISKNIDVIIRKKTLYQKGEKIIAYLSYVDTNCLTTIQGKNPYYIVCKYVDEVTGQEREFKSEYFYFDPNPIIEEKNITTFPVYIDKKNPKKYYVSLEELK